MLSFVAADFRIFTVCVGNMPILKHRKNRFPAQFPFCIEGRHLHDFVRFRCADNFCRDGLVRYCDCAFTNNPYGKAFQISWAIARLTRSFVAPWTRLTLSRLTQARTSTMERSPAASGRHGVLRACRLRRGVVFEESVTKPVENRAVSGSGYFLTLKSSPFSAVSAAKCSLLESSLRTRQCCISDVNSGPVCLRPRRRRWPVRLRPPLRPRPSRIRFRCG